MKKARALSIPRHLPVLREVGMPMKQQPEDLAILGGRPAFTDPLHVGCPNIGDKQRLFARLDGMLERRRFTNDGPLVREFEERLAKRLGVRHCLAVCNCTAGLEIAIRAAGLTGEVIVPSFTFVATAHALMWMGLTPVFADVDRDTHTLDPKSVERLIGPRTAGILGVHLWGRAFDADELSDLAKRHGLVLMFDAAHAFGCTYRGIPVGRLGLATVFSFHATKILNSLEGGAITTDDDDFAAKVRLLRNFGFAGYDRVVSLGTNGKMSEAAAAMGLTSLESFDDFVTVNRRNHGLYARALADIPGVRLLAYDGAEENNFHYVVLEIRAAEAGLTRDQLHAILWAENILTRRYFYPGCHRMEPYRSIFPDAGRELPATEDLVRSVLCLPTGAAMHTGDIATIAAIIRLATGRSAEIVPRLTAITR